MGTIYEVYVERMMIIANRKSSYFFDTEMRVGIVNPSGCSPASNLELRLLALCGMQSKSKTIRSLSLTSSYMLFYVMHTQRRTTVATGFDVTGCEPDGRKQCFQMLMQIIIYRTMSKQLTGDFFPLNF